MAWFKSRRTPGGDQQMDYLNATDTTVRPLALPSLLVALLLVSAIAFLLFVIGRWGYQEISKSDTPTSSEVATTEPAAPTDGSDTTGGSDNAGGDTNASQGTGTTDDQSGSTDSSTNTTSTSSTTNTGTTGSDTSTSSTQTESIPNTGATSLLGIFAVTAILGSAGYYVVTIRSLQRSR